MYHGLHSPITARFIRFLPMAWSNSVALRVELYGCIGTVCLSDLNLLTIYLLKFFYCFPDNVKASSWSKSPMTSIHTTYTI